MKKLKYNLTADMYFTSFIQAVAVGLFVYIMLSY